MTNEETPFGQALYEALTLHPGGERIVGRLKDAQIQQFKAADRAGVQALFKGTTDYATIQHIKSDTPEALADHLAHRELQSAKAADEATLIMLFGLMFSG